MPRFIVRGKDPFLGDDAAREAAKQVADWVGPRREKKPPTAGTSKRQREALIEEVRERWASGDWDGMGAGRLVAVYWICHEMVYKVPPMELASAKEWKQAMLSAGAMVREHFDGDVMDALEFMKWVWKRERFLEPKRRERNDDFTVGWKYQFRSAKLITQYRIDQERKRGIR